MSTKKLIIVGIVGLLVVTLGYRIYTSVQKSQAKPVATSKAVPIKVEAVTARLIQDTVVLTGSVTAEKLMNVSPKVSGQVLAVLVNEGDTVTKGQVLATIESADLDQFEQSLILANNNYENAKLNWERSQKLFQDGVISQQQLESAKLQFTAAETSKKQAESHINYLKSSTGSAGGNASRLVAPFPGVILKKFAEEGTMVGPGNPNPVVTIGKIDRVKVLVNVEEKMLSFLRRGQTVTVAVDAWPDPFTGRVENILPQIDPVTRTIAVEVMVANGNRRLLPGMYAKISLARRVVDKVPAIPANAVLEDESGAYVYVLEQNKAVLRQVVTGLSDEKYVEILSGLAIGEEIIVAGQHSVESGSKVEVVGRAN